MAAFQDDTGKIWVFVSASKDLGIDSNIHYYTYDGTTWTCPTDVPGPISGSHVDAFQAANGSIWIFYESAGVKCIQTPDYGMSWSSVITVSATGGIPKVIEADGKLHAVWCEWPTGKIYYSNSTDGVTWSTPQIVVDVVGKYNNDPVISVDSNGTYWLFYAPWTGRDGGLPDSQWIEVVYSSDDGATWSSRINVTGGGYGNVYWDDMWPEPYLDSNGKMLLFYTSERNADGTSRIDRNIWMFDIVWDLRNNHYEFIQTAIDTASSGDTIIVHDGTYNEALYINKTLELRAASTPVINGSMLVTTNYYNVDAVIFVEDTIDVVIEGFDIEGSGWSATRKHAVQWEDSTGTIRNCTVSPNTIGDTYGLGIAFWDNSNLTIDSCTIKNFGRVGVYCRNSSSGGVYNSTVIGQVYSEENKVNYGIEVEGLFGSCDIEIMGNEIYNCDNTYSPEPTWSSAGIIIDTWREYMATPNSTVIMRCNNIHDNYYGIEVVANPLIYAHYNNIYNNREYGAFSAPDYLGNNETFDARYNWWGDASGPYHSTLNLEGLGDNVSDYVLFEPWLLQVKVPPLVHDIAIISIVPSVAHQYAGRMVNITVVVKNNGNMYETFNVTAYRNNTSIGTILVTDLGIGENTTLIFQWNTSGLTPCQNWTIRVEAPITGDVYPSDNNVTDGTVKIKMLGDVNGDGVINLSDLVKAAMAFGSVPGSWAWDPQADTLQDDRINISDLVRIAQRFGQRC